MRNCVKKVMASCAALALATLGLMSGVGTANAASTAKITLTATEGETLSGHDFTAYLIGSYSDVQEDGTNVTSLNVTAPDDATKTWIDAALTANGVTADPASGGAYSYASLTDQTKVRKIAQSLAGAQTKPTSVGTLSTEAASGDISSLAEGLYLVTDTAGNPIVIGTTAGGKSFKDQALEEAIVKPTTDPTQLTKSVFKSDGSTKIDAAGSQSIGTTEVFKVEYTLPSSLQAQDVTISDVATSLEIDTATIKATLSDGTDVTAKLDGTVTKDGFTYSSKNLYPDYAGKRVTITYSAKIISDQASNKATSTVTPNEGIDKPTTPENVETTNTVGGFDLAKVSAADGSVIKGAGFKLQDSATNKWAVSDAGSFTVTSWTDDEADATQYLTPENGTIDFYGLGAGTYHVKETTVPDGYFTSVKPEFDATLKIDTTVQGSATDNTASDDGDVQFKGTGLASGLVSAKDGATVEVKNVNSLTQLPQTGAAGIALSVLAGIALIGAGLSIVAFEKKHSTSRRTAA
jgi:LPXTG-motif cell wall-anchored protein